MTERFFSTPEVAKILGISRIAVFKQIKNGTLPASRAGRSYLVTKKDLLALYKKRHEKAARRAPRHVAKKSLDPLDRF
ncbi:MAG: hypothetical protein COU11_00880 [Candidatus Harrisonbacteria bacterium CG10_big_fil_rev_8_21_14_0_10_49_15]|uniref:Helix-turn-helix domain-containing protein n=1 Tax=Candidatus Harrisonbacteria bacterium CG10_big_fil_rev_8_21_14_0_10_49_15 TaxID=1974587 RepID=A0A2H0ULT8_9BACT|nr:MAG: hypothetical protein COU11_00880 [Candidatus Harrisonbacteria bacterium CG10_big_fil_rev_8_21_14_0_10_49_15]